MIALKVRVTTGAVKFALCEKNGVLNVRVKARPHDGAANAELLTGLRNIVGVKAFLASGSKSREKEVVFEGVSDEEAMEKCSKFSGCPLNRV